MQERFRLPGWQGGWADIPHISSDAMESDQSPTATLWGPTGGKGSAEGEVEAWGICMQDGRQCIKR